MDTFSSITKNDAVTNKFVNPAGIITNLLPFIYATAGILLFLNLLWGGLILMTAAGDGNKTKEGYGKISASLIGFVIIFVSYFAAQLIQVVFGVLFL